MNSDQQWIVNAFLKELEGLKFTGTEPLYKVDRKLKLAEMVLTEIPGDDPEEIALRATAEAVRDLCLLPTDKEVIERYLSTRRAHLDLLKSVWPQLGEPH